MVITINGPQNIGQIQKQFITGNLFLSPVEYQRENAWNYEQKKLLVDTVFRGMDIPKIYLWKVDFPTLVSGYPDGATKDLYKKILEKKRLENDDPEPYVYEVVDGQQRIRTFLEFMGAKAPNATVYRGAWQEPFETLTDTPMAKGKSYLKLNAEQQIKFDESPLSVMILEKASIDEIRDMFLRLQNGTPLNAQQKRDALGSKVDIIVRQFVRLPFFTQSLPFGNESSGHHQIAAQMLLLESNDKIVSCTSQRLDRFYKNHKALVLDEVLTKRARKIVDYLGKVFPLKNPHLNRSYVVSLYWVFSRILKNYPLDDSAVTQIRENFEQLNHDRLIAMERDYANKPSDDIYEDLSLAMSRGTDGLEAIEDRHDILTQFLFNKIVLTPYPSLDPIRLFSHEEKLILYRLSSGKCQIEHDGFICGKPISFEDSAVDHILPHSKQGKTELANGRIAYKLCNIARGNRNDYNPKTDCNFPVNSTESESATSQ